MKQKQPSLKSLNVNIEPISKVALYKHLSRERVVNQIIDKYVDEFISSLSKHDLDSEYILILKSIWSYCQKGIKEKVYADEPLIGMIDDSLGYKDKIAVDLYSQLIERFIKTKAEDFLILGKLTVLYFGDTKEALQEELKMEEVRHSKTRYEISKLNREKDLLHNRIDYLEKPDKRKAKYDIPKLVEEFKNTHPQYQNMKQEDIAPHVQEWLHKKTTKKYALKYIRPMLSYKIK